MRQCSSCSRLSVGAGNCQQNNTNMDDGTETFSFDAETLIQMVKERPSIWDKDHDTYKNKAVTYAAWNEICAAMIDNYDELGDVEKTQIAKGVMKKWGNLRDNFMKCTRRLATGDNVYKGKQSIVKVSKRYLFYDQMKFLEKVSKYQPLSTNSRSPQSDYSEEPAVSTTRKRKIKLVKDLVPETTTTTKEEERPLPKIVQIESLEKQTYCESSNNHSQIMSFFKGIAPTIERFNDEDIVEFQFEVMKAIRTIQQRNSAARHMQPHLYNYDEYGMGHHPGSSRTERKPIPDPLAE